MSRVLSFDFIATPAFRDSLQSDAAEMEAAFKARAWKACQVMAGSIVEAILVDYLFDRKPASLKGRDPLTIVLAEAIDLCTAEGVLSSRTKDMCAAIRSYRNLIHPGRAHRLEEEPPSEATAQVATGLVQLIVADVARARRRQFGLTADQVLAKLANDHNSLTLLSHLLPGLHDNERRRLLLDLLPARFAANAEAYDSSFDGDEQRRLLSGFRTILGGSSESIKKEVAHRLVVMLLESDSGAATDFYADSLFQISDMEHIDASSRPLVIDYFMSKLPKAHNRESGERMASLAKFLPLERLPKWLAPYIATLTSKTPSPETIEALRRTLAMVYGVLEKAQADAIDSRLQELMAIFERNERFEACAAITHLQGELASWRFDDFPGDLNDE